MPTAIANLRRVTPDGRLARMARWVVSPPTLIAALVVGLSLVPSLAASGGISDLVVAALPLGFYLVRQTIEGGLEAARARYGKELAASSAIQRLRERRGSLDWRLRRLRLLSRYLLATLGILLLLATSAWIALWTLRSLFGLAVGLLRG